MYFTNDYDRYCYYIREHGWSSIIITADCSIELFKIKDGKKEQSWTVKGETVLDALKKALDEIIKKTV